VFAMDSPLTTKIWLVNHLVLCQCTEALGNVSEGFPVHHQLGPEMENLEILSFKYFRPIYLIANFNNEKKT
jgi:hypothetical protein